MKEDHFILLTTVTVAGLALASQHLSVDFSALSSQLSDDIGQSSLMLNISHSAMDIIKNLLHSLLR